MGRQNILDRVIADFAIPVAPLFDALDKLFVEHGVRFNMETIEYNYDDPSIYITLEEIIKRLTNKRALASLEHWEQALLDHFLQMEEELVAPPSEEYVGVDYRILVAGFEPLRLQNLTVREILDQLMERDPDYQWEAISTGGIRVFPADGKVTQEAGRHSNSVLNWECPALTTGFNPIDLTHLFDSQTPIGRALEFRNIYVINSQWLTGEEKVILTIPPGTSARDALDLIAAALGPGYNWFYHNTNSYDYITFNTRIRIPRPN